VRVAVPIYGIWYIVSYVMAGAILVWAAIDSHKSVRVGGRPEVGGRVVVSLGFLYKSVPKVPRGNEFALDSNLTY